MGEIKIVSRWEGRVLFSGEYESVRACVEAAVAAVGSRGLGVGERGGEAMKPWTAKKQIARALANEDVRIGERETPTGKLRGLYAKRAFGAGDYVASFHGKVVTRERLFELHKEDRVLFDRVNEYAVLSTELGGHLYPEDLDRVGAHLINHACGPNAVWAEIAHGAMLVRALRPIAEGEELAIHYGWLGVKAAYEGKRHACACASPFCCGTVELYVELVEDDDGKGGKVGGPLLPPEEVSRRFFADVCNDTDANEGLLWKYAKESASLLHDTKVLYGIDPVAFFEKLRAGAEVALRAARMAAHDGRVMSARRVRAIEQRYEVRL